MGNFSISEREMPPVVLVLLTLIDSLLNVFHFAMDE